MVLTLLSNALSLTHYIKTNPQTQCFIRFWSQKQGEFLLTGGSGSKSAKLESLVSATLRHALVSMLVTSLTTTAAFMASLVSNITAIKCFR